MLGSSFNTSMHLSRVKTFQPRKWGKQRDKGQRSCLMPSGGHRSSSHSVLQEMVSLWSVSWNSLKCSQLIGGLAVPDILNGRLIWYFFNLYIFLILFYLLCCWQSFRTWCCERAHTQPVWACSGPLHVFAVCVFSLSYALFLWLICHCPSSQCSHLLQNHIHLRQSIMLGRTTL